VQLADEGALDLHRDIREHLPDLGLEHAVSAHQLLTHTAGFGEKFAGGFTSLPGRLQPLADYLRRYALHAVRPGARVQLLEHELRACRLARLLPAFAITAWRERWWTRRERVAHSALAMFAVVFMVFLITGSCSASGIE
jgi:CubicO group peptidase (beta-lactamase class C family)